MLVFLNQCIIAGVEKFGVGLLVFVGQDVGGRADVQQAVAVVAVKMGLKEVGENFLALVFRLLIDAKHINRIKEEGTILPLPVYFYLNNPE